MADDGDRSPPPMTPLNLALRFGIELGMLAALARAGLHTTDDPLGRLVAAMVLPGTAMLLWGVFAVEGDPSRSGHTVVRTPGWLRLLLEYGLFGLAALGLWWTGSVAAAVPFTALVLLHSGLSLPRLRWLLRR